MDCRGCGAPLPLDHRRIVTCEYCQTTHVNPTMLEQSHPAPYLFVQVDSCSLTEIKS